MPLDVSTDAERSVRDSLVSANIRSVAELLDSHPEDLHVDILNRANAVGLAGILEASEKTTASVAKAVGDVVQKLASEGRLVSRDDFRVSALVSDFRKALTDALKGALPEETVGVEIDRAAGNLG
jgi:hypothetical protein